MIERLLLIVGGAAVPERLAAALRGVRPGTALVQLRDKALGGRALFELATAALAVARAAGARLVVNDRVDVALAAGAEGVHLPEAGLPVAEARRLGVSLLGASRHTAAAARAALDQGADYVALGPIWETPGKGPPLGPEVLGELAGLPIFALGGIDGPARAQAARRAGAHGVAVVRALDQAAALSEVLS